MVREKDPVELCEVTVIHEDVLARVREKMPDETPVYETLPGHASSAR